MPDPTTFTIIVTFGTALLLFVIAALAKGAFRRQTIPASELEFQPTGDDFSPYNTPMAAGLELPPELPTGRVPVWFYRPVDLLGIAFIFLVFFGLVLSSLNMPKAAEPQIHPFSLVVSIAFQFIIAGIALVFVIARIGPVEWLGLKWPNWHWVFLIAPGTVFAMWMVFGALQFGGYMEWMESLGVEPVQDTVRLLQNTTDPLVLGLMGFAAVIAAPFCEEVVFRGYVYPAAKKFAGPGVAMVCSALIFGAAHGSLAALLPLFIFGCVLVYLYEKTGSLWAPIAVHLCFNGATVFVQLASRYWSVTPEAAL
jgi:membrane protease YdiL (CAAX protease family)